MGSRIPSRRPIELGADDWVDEAFDEDEDIPDAAAEGRLVERLVADIAALEARLLKDRAFEADRAGDAQIAAESARAYAAIWARIGSWYAGINAAAMALVAGNPETAQELAGRVLKRLPGDPKDYWAAATRAEAFLLSGERAKGLQALKAAGAAADANDSARASTMLQLRRLAPRLQLDMGEVEAQLGVRRVAVVAGHLFRGGEMDAATQAKASEVVRAGAEEIFARQNIGNVFGALASGSDIVIAEAALDRGQPFHAVIPFPLERFTELSVDIGDAQGAVRWRERLGAVLQRAASLTLVDDEPPLDRDLDGHFFHAFRFMAGFAMMRAAVLETECRLIAVTDGAAAANMAGASRARCGLDRRGARRRHDRVSVQAQGAGRPCARGNGVSSGRASVGHRGRARRRGGDQEGPRRSQQGFLDRAA